MEEKEVKLTSFAKSKGSGYEGEIAKFLTEFFGYKFERAPFSGAFLGGVNSVRNVSDTLVQVLGGDIIPPSDLKYLYSECKRGESTYIQLNKPDMPWIESWVKQNTLAKKLEGSKIFTFMRRNREPSFIIVEQDIFDQIVTDPDFTFINYLCKYDNKHYIITIMTNVFCDKYKEKLIKLFSNKD